MEYLFSLIVKTTSIAGRINIHFMAKGRAYVPVISKKYPVNKTCVRHEMHQ